MEPRLRGYRKFLLGVLYLALTTGLGFTSLLTGKGDLFGVAALSVSVATGLTAVVWGNVVANKAAEGNSPPSGR